LYFLKPFKTFCKKILYSAPPLSPSLSLSAPFLDRLKTTKVTNPFLKTCVLQFSRHRHIGLQCIEKQVEGKRKTIKRVFLTFATDSYSLVILFHSTTRISRHGGGRVYITTHHPKINLDDHSGPNCYTPRGSSSYKTFPCLLTLRDSKLVLFAMQR